MAEIPTGLGASIVLCARVLPSKEAEFRQWCGRWQEAMLRSPGSESFELLPPTPDQDETAAVARFSTVDASRVWRHSEENDALIDEARPLVEGGLLMQLTGKAALEYYVQHSATEVIITQIKPEREAEYRAFAARIQKVQERFPGYIGSFVQPPHHKETGWTTILRFDSVGHLNAWMASPQRAALLKESEDLIHGFEAQRVDTSFPGWVPADPVTGRPPSIWKTASLVLLTLFPVVMLELRFLNPHLRGLPPAVATFIGNSISVALTTWPLMPLAIRAFRPWLFPEDQPPALVRAMPFVLLASYAVEIAVLWRLLL
jgi:uncharacterized protein